MKILVTGSNGQLGQEFKSICDDSQYQFTFVDIQELDITNKTSLNNYFKKETFDFILNCAAYTAVDKAENHPKEAMAVNREGVSNLISSCQKYNIGLVHFSTDYVFDGRHCKPYSESHATNPLGVYGKSKHEGERIIADSSISALIIRTSWLYSIYGANFVKTMINLGQKKDQIYVVFDQIGTPTNANDLARTALLCIENFKQWEGNRIVYHYSNEGVTSWYDFANHIFQKLNIDCQVNPILSKDFPTLSKRPHYSVLDKTKIKKDFGIKIKHWKESFDSLNFNINRE